MAGFGYELSIKIIPGSETVEIPAEYEAIKHDLVGVIPDGVKIDKELANTIIWISNNKHVLTMARLCRALSIHTIIYGTSRFMKNPVPDKTLDDVLEFTAGTPTGNKTQAYGPKPLTEIGLDGAIMGQCFIIDFDIFAMVYSIIEQTGGEPASVLPIITLNTFPYMVERWRNTKDPETPEGRLQYIESRNQAYREITQLQLYMNKFSMSKETYTVINEKFREVLSKII